MRFPAGLRLVVFVAALLGLVAAQSTAIPAAASHVAMATMTDAAHDCCKKTPGAPTDKAGLAGDCLDIGCFVAAPAVLPTAPAMALVIDRAIDEPLIATDLKGRSPSPLLEPPRA